MNHIFNTMVQNINEANARVPSHCSEDFEQNHILENNQIISVRLLTFSMTSKAQIQVLKFMG